MKCGKSRKRVRELKPKDLRKVDELNRATLSKVDGAGVAKQAKSKQSKVTLAVLDDGVM